MLKRTTVLAAATLAATAAPASAQVTTPQLSPLKRCYVAASEQQREPVAIDASGFTAFAKIEVFVDEIQQLFPVEPQANYDGTLHGSTLAPFVDEGERTFTLRLREQQSPTDFVSATSKVTRLEVLQKPPSAATSERVRFTGRGFTELTKPIYAHYVYGGRSRKTIKIGLPSGDCGVFSARKRQFPFKKSPRVGVWTIQFDQSRHYSAKSLPRVPLTVRVKRAIKPQS